MTGADAEIPPEAQAAFWRVYRESLDSNLERRTEDGLRAAFALMPAPVFVITEGMISDVGTVYWKSRGDARAAIRTAAEAAGFQVEERAEW